MLNGTAALLRRLMEALLWPFDRLPAAAGLIALGVISGVGMLAVVAVTTPQRRLRAARDRMSSAIYEIRLFLDSPGHIVRAQARLLVCSGRYLAYLLPAFVVLLPPLVLLFPLLEARYGLTALSPSEPVLVRVQLDRPALAALYTDQITLAPAPGLSLDAPPVRVAPESAVYLRLRLAGPGTYLAVIRGPSWSVDKQIVAQPGARVVPAERRRGASSLLAVGDEPGLAGAGPVAAVSVDHPPRAAVWAALPMPWWLLWLLAATATALALRRRMGVAL